MNFRQILTNKLATEGKYGIGSATFESSAKFSVPELATATSIARKEIKDEKYDKYSGNNSRGKGAGAENGRLKPASGGMCISRAYF